VRPSAGRRIGAHRGIGVRLGLSICVPHVCRCGALVDFKGFHCIVCKRAPGRISRYHALPDMMAREFVCARVPAIEEPNGLTRVNSKSSDMFTPILGRPANH